ncbi:hypothetical protein [Paenibacillus sp.]|uniref:hypothetical protein n=1 Tax=Paenibacillus sp. TaxID=58172 RepID=UPI0028125571|nr:hypothetical protein [Paenibacillus sp.]
MKNARRIRTTAVSLAVGGLFLALHHYCDWVVMRRLINTGYPDKYLLDFLLFLAPLLQGYGLLTLYRSDIAEYVRPGLFGLRLTCGALLAVSGAYFFAEWIYASSLPIFVLLFYPASFLLCIGLLFLQTAFRRTPLRLTLILLAIMNVAYPVLPQFAASNQGLLAGSSMKFALGLALGGCWVLLGACSRFRR